MPNPSRMTNFDFQDSAGVGEGSGDRPGCRWQACKSVRAAGAGPGSLPGAAQIPHRALRLIFTQLEQSQLP